MEKLKKYSSILNIYLKQRFSVFKFGLLSLMILILVLDLNAGIIQIAEKFVFIFASMLMFRMIDDAWSFYSDRINHSDRIYLNSENFKYFLGMTVSVSLLYHIILTVCWFDAGIILLSFNIISNVFYKLSYKNQKIMILLPLLKYPLIIIILSGFSLSTEVLMPALGVFLIMLIIDIFETRSENKIRTVSNYILLMIASLMILNPVDNQMNLPLYSIIIIIPLILIFLKKYKYMNELPIVVYSLIHFINRLINL